MTAPKMPVNNIIETVIAVRVIQAPGYAHARYAGKSAKSAPPPTDIQTWKCVLLSTPAQVLGVTANAIAETASHSKTSKHAKKRPAKVK